MAIRIEGYDLGSLYDVDIEAWGQPNIVQMLNGQVIEMTPGANTYIPASEGNSAFNLNLDFIETLTPQSNVIFNIIATAPRAGAWHIS